ncbi:type 4a pilus biogenesis protein PilO [bacterium]|nr:type 4a pilus biogenesis protein PilO [bacterium]
MKRNYTILIVLIIVLSFAYYYFASQIITDKVTEVAKLDQEIRKSRQELNSLIVQDEKLGEFTSILSNTLTKDNEFSSDEIHEIILTIDGIAQKYGINVSGINHGALFTASDQLEHEFSIEFTTTYVKLGRFMNELEKMDFLSVINSFSIDPERNIEKKQDAANVQELDKNYNVSLGISFIKHKMR